jgi:hypothetical protein
MNIRLKVFLFGLLLTIFSVPFFAQAAGETLTISPPISDFSLEPGESVTKTIRLSNPSESLIEVFPRTMNFRASGETGEPAFYEVGDSSEKFALASWISFDNSKLALAPEQVVDFEYKITVPVDAEPGGHYGAVFFANEPETTEDDISKVSMGSMIGSLLLVRTPGDVVESGAIDSFVTDKAFYVDNKINFITRVNNLGNIHIKPLGNVVVKDMFGKIVDTIVFNEQGGNVLPNSTREYTTVWSSSKLLLGYYKADLALTYGLSGQVFSGKTAFWVIPDWFIVLVSAIVLLLVVLVAWLVLRSNGANKRGPRPPSRPSKPAEYQPKAQPRPQAQPVDDQPKGPIILR